MSEAPAMASPSRPRVQRLQTERSQRLLGVGVAIVLLNLLVMSGHLFDGDAARPYNEGFWPSYGGIWSAFWQILTDGFQRVTLIEHTLASLGRVLFVLFVGSGVGGLLGYAMRESPSVRNIADPFVSIMRLFSPTMFSAMLVVFVGIGEAPLLIAVTSMVAFVFADGVGRRSVAPVDVARTALLVSWVSITAIELIGSQTGLGAMMWTARTFFRNDLMIAGALWSTAILVLLDYGIRFLARLVNPPVRSEP